MKWKQITGMPLIEAYGLTETSPAATINPLDLPAYNGSIGLPIPSTEVTLRDDAGKDGGARPARRDLHSRAAGDGGLLAPPGRDRQGDRQGRLVRNRRRRRHGRPRLRQDRRPQEGHDPGLGIQRLSERNRGRGSRCTRACWSAPPSASRTRSPAKPSSSSWSGKTRALTAEEDDAEVLSREPDQLQDARATSSSAAELPKSNVGKILRRELRDEMKRQQAAA